MKTPLLCALLSLGLTTPAFEAAAQARPQSETRSQAAITAQMLYQLLLGELSVVNGDTGAAVSLLTDAARKTNDPQIYQRAADVALASRSGESALQVARAWRQAHPRSVDANRYLVQILLALNRVTESSEPLRSLVELTPADERGALLDLLPSLYARAGDKKLAGNVVELALAPALAAPQSAAAAWSAVARLRALASDLSGALEAVQRAQAVEPAFLTAAQLAVALLDNGQTQAEAPVKRYLEAAKPVAPEVRLGYARALIELQRVRDSQIQLQVLTREQPDQAEGWLLLGTLQADTPALAEAQASLERFVKLAEGQGARSARSLSRAYLVLAQVAEKRGDIAAAEGWLAQDIAPDMQLQVLARRASLLARQGKLDQARSLIRNAPEREAGDARGKLLAEVSLLREHKQLAAAYELLARAAEATPEDPDLVYEQAMLAEKLGRLDEMERLLRRILAAKPDYHAAYNALGYSLADRGLRLQEAKALIQKALEFAPNDPFIQDSLAWVEFRLGRKTEALRVIETAFKARPDAEIAAHYGEILWSLGQRERARAIWREGLALQPQNDTLQETLKRLQVQP